MLALHVLGAVLADDLDPGLDERCRMSSSGHVLRRRDDRDRGAGLRADGRRTPRGRRRRSRELPGGPLEQPLAVVVGRVVDDVGEQHVQDPAEPRPFGEARSPRRSSPVTARSDRWCGCERSCVTSRRSSLDALELECGNVLRGEIGRLVVDEVERELVAVLGEETPGVARIGRVVEL